jgi:hypothetical protein
MEVGRTGRREWWQKKPGGWEEKAEAYRVDPTPLRLSHLLRRTPCRGHRPQRAAVRGAWPGLSAGSRRQPIRLRTRARRVGGQVGAKARRVP